MAALRVGNFAPLVGNVTSAVPESIIKDEAPDLDGIHEWPGECGIGSVTVLGFAKRPGVLNSENASDVAIVKVRWSGTRFRQSLGIFARRIAMIGIRTTILVLERPHNAKSHLDEGFSSSHCTGCGAPESKIGEGKCPHCGAPPAGWERRWQLAEIAESGTSAASAWIARLQEFATEQDAARVPTEAVSAPPPPTPVAEIPLKREVVYWLVSAAAAEGGVSPGERKAILRIAHRAGVSDIEADFIIKDTDPDTLPAPADANEARLWLEHATEVALSDGALSAAEKHILGRLAVALSLPGKEMNEAIRKAQSNVLMEARRELREFNQTG
jgi:uncharacterized membrane protein YebE (DUF533 family)